jgi:ribosomal subunit interface protein
MEVTPALREYAEQKVVRPVQKRLAALALSDAPVLDIEISRITHHHNKGMVYAATATLTLGRHVIRAESAQTEAHAACDALADEITREIIRYRTKSQSLMRRGARRAKQYLRLSPSAWFGRRTRERDEGR